MSLTFKAIEIQGFKSFRLPQVLKFGKQDSALIRVSGTNKVRPHLGPNGIGKSSIWDALVWCFYGKTARGLQAAAVANREGDYLCQVAVEFSCPSGDYRLTRTWKPNTLNLLDLRDDTVREVTQAQVESLVGLDYEKFLYTVLLGQFNPYFFDLGDTDKLNVFSNVLDLEFWLSASGEAKTRCKKYEDSVSRYEADIQSYEALLTNLSKQRLELEAQHEEWEAHIRGRRKAAEKEANALADELEKLEAAYLAQERAWEQDCTKIAAAEEALKGAQADLAAEQQKLYKVQQDYRAAQKESDDITANLKKLIRLQGATCSLCEQEVNETHVASQTEYHEQRLSDAASRIVEQEQAVTKAESSVSLRQTVWEGAKRAEELANEKCRQSGALREDLDKKLTRLEADHEHAVQVFDAVEEEYKKPPHAKQLAAVKKDIKHHTELLKEARQLLKDARYEKERVEYWIKGFKEMRLWLVQQALQELSVEVNNAVVQLGLVDWKVEFAIEKETKSGSVSKGFTVNIIPPNETDPVPWKAWSGGETQRLRIAGSIGLANLIRRRCGVAPNIEVWDEPTAHLSVEGTKDLVDFFEQRAKNEHRQIWLVDHRSLSSGAFDYTVNVSLEKAGTAIEQ